MRRARDRPPPNPAARHPIAASGRRRLRTAVSCIARGRFGLEHGADGGPSLLDGSVNHGNWFYAVGTNGEWNCGIPGATDCEGQVELWADWGEALVGTTVPPPPPPPYVHTDGWTLLFRQTAVRFVWRYRHQF